MSVLNAFSTIFNYFLFLLVGICWIIIIFRYIKGKHTSVKAVKAVVIDKYKFKEVSRFPHGAFSNEKYIIVFSAGKEKLSFCVSEFSYAGYKIKEKGTLKYKGNRIIDFK